MKRFVIAGLLILMVFCVPAFANDVQVVNSKTGFPEGPLWHQDKLF